MRDGSSRSHDSSQFLYDTVVVRPLPWSTTENDLRTAFGDYGALEALELRSGPCAVQASAVLSFGNNASAATAVAESDRISVHGCRVSVE